MDLDGRVARAERLDVGVDSEELDLADSGVDHAVDGVESCTADADDLDHREVGARVCTGAVQPRRRLRQRLEVTRDRRQVGRPQLRRRRRWQRIRSGRRSRRLRVRRRGTRHRLRRGSRRGRLDTGLLLPGRNVLDGALVGLGLSFRSGGRGVLGRLLLGLAAMFGLPLRRLGGAEELRQWPFTHACAPTRHRAPPSPGHGTSRRPRRMRRT